MCISRCLNVLNEPTAHPGEKMCLERCANKMLQFMDVAWDYLKHDAWKETTEKNE